MNSLPATIQLGGITLHLYGFLVGVAVAVAWSAIERKLRSEKLWRPEQEWFGLAVILGGVIGARVWHVVTDWRLYSQHWWSALAIWQGGLSILGAIMGGVAGLMVVKWRYHDRVTWGQWLDAMVFGLPLGQMIGRLANFLNQELYGYPTNLPWGITIDLPHRLQGFGAYTRFHPLFAYEMIATGLAAGVFWWWSSQSGKRLKPKWLRFGTGRWFGLYIWYYSLIRFGLDFLRPDRTLATGGIGLNQLVLLAVAVISGTWLSFQLWHEQKH